MSIERDLLIIEKTNLWFMYLSAKGIHNCLTNGHSTVFLVSFIGYLLVGTGSFLFHATLKCMFVRASFGSSRSDHAAMIDPMQLVDELSMIYTTCLMCYVTFSFDRTKNQRMVLGTSLVGLSLFITLYYHVSGTPKTDSNLIRYHWRLPRRHVKARHWHPI